MNATQIEHEIIQNSKGLPADILLEILDFIKFLKIRRTASAADSIQAGLSELDASELRHLEEEFADYKIVYPHE